MNYAEKYLSGHEVIDIVMSKAVNQAIVAASRNFHSFIKDFIPNSHQLCEVRGKPVPEQGFNPSGFTEGLRVSLSVDRLVGVLETKVCEEAAAKAAEAVTKAFDKISRLDDAKIAKLIDAATEEMATENKELNDRSVAVTSNFTELDALRQIEAIGRQYGITIAIVHPGKRNML